MLDALFAYFIPRALRDEDDIDTYRRARLAVLLPLVGIAGPLYAIPFFRMGFDGAALLCIGLGGLDLLAPYLLRWIGSVRAVGNLLAATAVLHVTLIVGVTGGLSSLAVPWLVNAVLLALLLAGKRSAVAWLGFVVVEVGGLYALEQIGITIPTRIPVGSQALLAVAVQIGLILVIFGLSFLFEREKDHAVQVLSEARHEAEAATARAEQLAGTLREQRDRIEEQAIRLRELDAAKSRFFANVSHELRTPLTLMLGPLQQLQEAAAERLTDDEVQRLGLVIRNGRRLQRLIEQVLDLVEVDAGTLELQARPVRLADTVHRIASMYDSLADRHGLILTVDTESRPPEVEPLYADPEQLEHVVGNLLSNALKFTPEGGQVTVRAWTEAEVGVIEVADTGPGIPPDRQEAVFDRFEQGEDARSSEGSGIGLAYVKELVELHGGTIEVESVEGEGTAFTVRLPRGPEHLPEDSLAEAPTDEPLTGEEAPEADPPPVPPSVGPRPDSDSVTDEATALEEGDPDRTTVLVVDDNADVRQYVRSVLTPDFRVRTASDGEAGLAAAREHLPDCILADVMMPGTGGVEMVKALREDPATDCIPVIMLTARAATEDELEGLGAGADDYVTKPFDPAVLQARVRGQIDLRRRLRRRVRKELQAGDGDGQTRGDAEPSGDSAAGDAAAGRPPQLVVPTPSDEETEFVASVREAIEERLADPDLEVEALAEAVHVSRSTLYRRLKEEADCTPTAFLRQVRVQHGARLLREQEGTISEVAYAVGFNSLTYFSRAFREHFGLAPSDYVERGA